MNDPQKLIQTRTDMDMWFRSPAKEMIVSMIKFLMRGCIGKLRPIPLTSHAIQIISILDKAITIFHETPPSKGNPLCSSSFPLFLSRIREANLCIKNGFGKDAEIYFDNSFGSSTRKDYGTGHELNFIAFLAVLRHDNFIDDEDAPALACEILWSYWKLIREIIQVYRIPPAGSRGVWGMDDFVLLPFLVGSGQLVGNKIITPKNVFALSKNYSQENILCMWIEYLQETKKDLFEESCQRLIGIQEYESFSDVLDQMMVIYEKDVLSKFVIVNQFIFTNSLPGVVK